MWCSVLLFLIFSVSVIIYLCQYAKKKPKNFPPGPPRLPLWGSYWFLLKENYNFSHVALENLSRQYQSDILGLFLGDYPAVVTFSHELCKELLTRDEFIGRNDGIVIRERSMGEPRGVFFVDGPFWKAQRRFSLRHLRDFGFGRRSKDVESFTIDEIKYIIDFLNKEPGTEDLDICKRKGQVLIPDLLFGPLFNIIFSIIASTRFDYKKLREIGRSALRFQQSGDATGSALSMTPWLRFFAPTFFGYTAVVDECKNLFDFVEEITNEHLKTFSDEHHRDFIDAFISESYRNGGSIDCRQLIMIVLDYMFPAANAIGHTLSIYFAFLINNPQVQIAMQEEIDRVVGQSRLPHLDDRERMPYVEASLKEGIRILPLNPLGIPRRCMEDTYLGGYFVPKDTIMLPCIWTAHKDERVWENPEFFDPKRFLDSDGKLLKKDNTIGFGEGKRLCAGQTFARHTMFLIVASLLQNFTLKSATDRPIEFNLAPGINLSLPDNWITFVPREC